MADAARDMRTVKFSDTGIGQNAGKASELRITRFAAACEICIIYLILLINFFTTYVLALPRRHCKVFRHWGNTVGVERSSLAHVSAR